MEKLKVCVLSPSYPLSNEDSRVHFVHEYFKEISKYADVRVVTSSGPMQKREDLYNECDGVKIYRFDYFFPRKLQRLSHTKTGGITESFKKSIFAKIQMPFFLFFYFLKGLAVARKCDIIDAQWGLSSIVAYPISLILRKPVSCKLRDGNINNMPVILSKLFLSKIDIIDGMNPPNFEFAKKISKNKVISIRGITNLRNLDRKFDKYEFKRSLGIRKDEKVVAFIARLAELKDPLTFVRSIPYVIKINPKIKFIVVGNGHLMNEVLEEIKKINVENNVIVTGSRQDVYKFFKISDIFAATSYQNHCFSNTIIESMYAEVPVILTNAPFTKEVFRDSVYIVPVKDPAQLAQGILFLLNDPKKLRSLKEEGKNFIKNEGFLKEDVVKNVLEMYNELLRTKK